MDKSLFEYSKYDQLHNLSKFITSEFGIEFYLIFYIIGTENIFHIKPKKKFNYIANAVL